MPLPMAPFQVPPLSRGVYFFEKYIPPFCWKYFTIMWFYLGKLFSLYSVKKTSKSLGMTYSLIQTIGYIERIYEMLYSKPDGGMLQILKFLVE